MLKRKNEHQAKAEVAANHIKDEKVEANFDDFRRISVWQLAFDLPVRIY